MSSNNPPIQFHYIDVSFPFPSRNQLKQFISSLFQKEGNDIEAINYIFCSDDYLLEVNRTHLNHDYYTDIITFYLHEPGQAIISDIYISIDRVRDNATQHNVKFQTELKRVMFHGALHLCGYKDKSSKDIKLMRKKEDEYLDLYTVSRGTR